MTHTHLPGLFHTHHHAAGVPAVGGRGAHPHAMHVTGWLLPAGEPVEFWVRDAVVTTEPVPGADTVASDVWIMPGLVDAHSHVGLNAGGATSAAEAEQQAMTERDAGVLLIRDAGSPSDTRWVDERADLPKIVRAGRHIARPKRYIRNYAAEVEPAELVAEVRRQARAGDGWVKLVGDWIDRDRGDLAPLWPAEIASSAIQAAHEEGAKVTAHCFGEESVAQLVAAGIDGIEHGTGMTDDVINQMAERQVALVPTMINLENFPGFASAGQQRFPTYAAHMRKLFGTRLEALRHAREAGVPIFAGTDAGGTIAHGLVAEEIIRLGEIGDNEFALGAASWRARTWLGFQGIEPGSSADFVAYAADPRIDLKITRHPKLIVLRGVVYRP